MIAKFAYGTNTKQIQTIEQTRQAEDWQTKVINMVFSMFMF
jgi:hypothetical protein